jgi:hypothetical protein
MKRRELITLLGGAAAAPDAVRTLLVFLHLLEGKAECRPAFPG